MTSDVVERKPVEALQNVLEQLSNVIVSVDCPSMTEENIAEYRKFMLKVQSTAIEGVAKTGRKEHNYDTNEISAYIDLVLQRAFDLIETNPGDVPKLKDAQTIKRYRSLIKERVKLSPFGEANFHIKELSVQRRNIENSASLHELRQNVKAMIPVLKLYLDYCDSRNDNEEVMKYTAEWVPAQEHDAVLCELEIERKLSADRKRVIEEIIDGLYLPSSEMTGEELLKAVDDFKIKHQCSDEEAAKVFGTSRSKITRLRKENKLR